MTGKFFSMKKHRIHFDFFQVLEVGRRGETCNCTGFSCKQNIVSAGHGAAAPFTRHRGLPGRGPAAKRRSAKPK